MIITIDGPSGSGKSTISKLLAKKLNFNYLDTGAMYRAICLYLLESKIDIHNEEEVNKVLSHDQIDIDFSDDFLILNGDNVEEKIRRPRIDNNVSLVSSYKKVRDILVGEQRKIANNKDIILDGRDTGSVVFPNADIKFYLTATAEARAQRRFEQRPDGLNYDEVLKTIIERDRKDTSRTIAPLVVPENAIIIDSSNLTIDETLEKFLIEIRNVKDEL